MLLVAYLTLALLIGVFIGRRLKKAEKGEWVIEDLKKGSGYRLAGKVMDCYHAVRLVSLNEPDAVPKWYRCFGQLPPPHHEYLWAEVEKGKTVLKPIAAKMVSAGASLPVKA